MSEAKPKVKLSNEDGNVFNIIALCSSAAKAAGWDKKQINEFTQKCFNCESYDDVLVLCMENFQVE